MQFDRARAEAFGERLLSILNSGGLCLMISVGHRTGLFDVMRGMPASTSADIASRAGLNERYVREWLGAMVTGGIVDVDPESRLFALPAEHAVLVTRKAGPDNVASFTQYIAVLGGVEDDIVECFRNGGGVPYEKFPRFQEVMADDSGQFALGALEPLILPLVPGLVARLTTGIRAVDLGCGSGRIVNRLAALFPNSRFRGMDLSTEAIATARADAAAQGLPNVVFERVDLTDFDRTAVQDSVDLVMTFDAIHDQARPLNVLKGIHRTLAADGVYLMQEIRGSSHIHRDISNPIAPFLYSVSCMHCMTVSLAQGGEGLGAMWGEEKTREYLERAGFRSVETHQLPGDIQNNWYVVTK